MSRPNAFAVIERVLNLQDKLFEGNEALLRSGKRIRELEERVRLLQAEVAGFDSILQHSIKEQRILQERLEAVDCFRPHPDVPEVTSITYLAMPSTIHNEHQP